MIRKSEKRMLKLESIYGNNGYLLEAISSESYNSIYQSTLLCLIKKDFFHDNNTTWIGKTVIWSINNCKVGLRKFTGIITDYQALPYLHQLRQYQLIKLNVSSSLYKMTQIDQSRTWNYQKISSIIEDLCHDMNHSKNLLIDFDTNNELETTIKLGLQYQQNNWSYLKQLCDDHQIFFWLDKEKLYLRKHINAYTNFKIKLKWLSQSSPEQQGLINLMRNVNLRHKQQCQEWLATDYNSNNVFANLQQRWRTRSENTIGFNQLFPSGKLTYDPKLSKVKQKMNELAPDGYELDFHTQLPNIKLGHIIEFKANFNVPKIMNNHQLLPTHIYHRALDYSNLPLDGWHYWLPKNWRLIRDIEIKNLTTYYDNHIHAFPWSQQPYIPELPEKLHAKIQGFHTAFVGGHNKSNKHINAEGDIAIYFPWDTSIGVFKDKQFVDLNDCTYARYRYNQNGIQFHPKPGDEVLVSFENHRPDRPIIIGSAYREDIKPPLNIKNKKNLNGIRLDKHLLYVNDDLRHANLILQSMGDTCKKVGNTYDEQICVHQQFIEKSNLTCANKNISICAYNGKIKIKSKEAIVLNTPDGQIHIDSNLITIHSNAINLITPNSTVGNIATIGNQHHCPKKNTDHSNHQGGPITSGSGDVFIHKKAIARIGDTAKCIGPTDVIRSGNDAIKINGQGVALTGSKTKHGGQITEGANGVGVFQNQFQIDKVKKKDKNRDIQIHFKLRASNGYEPIISNALINLISCNKANSNHTNIPTHRLHGNILIHNVAGGEYEYYLSPQNMELAILSTNNIPQIPYFKSKLYVNDKPNTQDNHINSKRRYESKILWPMMMLNLREKGPNHEKAKALGARDKIDMLDIQYFKNNGNNATLFIHGYNVEVGQLGKELIFNDKTQSINFGNSNASIYRNKTIVRKQMGININTTINDESKKKLNKHLKLINGTGAFGWAICMENNLNRSTNKFAIDEPTSYQTFTRLLHITWEGNVGKIINTIEGQIEQINNPIIKKKSSRFQRIKHFIHNKTENLTQTMMYNEAVDIAQSKKTSMRLAENLVKLIDSGIHVNVVAHSLGNGLLLETMRCLSIHYPGKMIDHIYMWQAAVPNNVFYRPKKTKRNVDNWDYQKGLDAVKKVTILFSSNDNILGPFIDDKHKGKNDVPNDWVDQHKPINEWIAGYLSELLGIESIYHLAMTIGKETHLLLDKDVQEEIYNYFLHQHRSLIFQGGTDDEKKTWFTQKKYMRTLEEQISMANRHHNFSKEVKTKCDAMITKLHKDLNNEDSRLRKFLRIYFFKFRDHIECNRLIFKKIHRIQSILNKHEAQYNNDYKNIRINHLSDIEHKAILSAEESIITKVLNDYPNFFIMSLCKKKLTDEVKSIIVYELTHKKHISGIIYLLSMMQHKKLEIGAAPAMGSTGINIKKIPGKYKKKFTKQVVQNKWLFSHSGMKEPTKELLDNVYKKIMLSTTIGFEKFGEYL